jgi:hypothetical protein
MDILHQLFTDIPKPLLAALAIPLFFFLLFASFVLEETWSKRRERNRWK